MRSLLLTSLFALAGMLPAQNCGTLAITGSGAAGTQLGIGVTGATANAIAFVIVGQTTGTTTLPLPMGGSLVLGLASPFLPLPIGRTDANGDVSLQITVPAAVTQQIALNAQAAAIGFSFMPFSITGCTSNVVAFTIG